MTQAKAEGSRSEVSMRAEAAIVTLLPFLVRSSLAIAIMRGLLARGVSVAVAFCSKESGAYTADRMEDFDAQGRLIDLSGLHRDQAREILQKELAARRTRLLCQAGAYTMYPTLPYLKEQCPRLKLVDVLYNEVGHTVNHFLYENCFDAVIVETNQMRQFVARSTSKPAAKITVVESGVDLTHFSAKEDRSAAAPLHVAFIGRMSAEKNPSGFIDIAESVGPQLNSARFSLFGEGPLAGTIRQRVADSPMGLRLAYPGAAEDVRAALHTIDVLIVPSKFDGRPNIIMEAAACGVPVIAAPVGGIPELVQEGQNGVLLAAEQMEPIAQFLRGLESDFGLRTQWRSRCRAVAEARFDRNRMLDRYQAAFLELMES